MQRISLIQCWSIPHYRVPYTPENTAHPAELLMSSPNEELLRKVFQKNYDYVIVDNSTFKSGVTDTFVE